VSPGTDISGLFNSLVSNLEISGSREREGVFLRRSPGGVAPLLVTDVSGPKRPELSSLISHDLRIAVQTERVQEWVSVAIPRVDDTSTLDPGILIGSTVEVPALGQYELYYLYSLAPEQETLSFIQRVLAAAGSVLVLLLGAMTWLVTRQAVQPVRSAAGVAERLADGHLSERMTVKGVDEMATLARSFNEMAESLQDQIHRMEELSHLQRRFVSDVSHELRTPLTTIRMAAEVIHASREELDPAASRSSELLTAQLDRFEALLADLLEISRFDAGAAMLDAESHDVCEVVCGAIEQAGPLAGRRGVWLVGEVPE
jgi:two-component system sensor histidine kinase MtrB